MTGIIEPPSLKKWLIGMNVEIDFIVRKIPLWDRDPLLSDIEFYVLVLEDRRFFKHNGVDIISIIREVFRLLTFRKYGGASTVDMQFVRTATGRYDRTIGRKIREAVAAKLLRYQASKVCILRGYLDIAYFGTGLSGVYDATMAVYGLPPSQIRGGNAAFIASMLLSPCPRIPTQDWTAKVQKRADYALRIGSGLEESFKKVGMR